MSTGAQIGKCSSARTYLDALVFLNIPLLKVSYEQLDNSPEGGASGLHVFELLLLANWNPY